MGKTAIINGTVVTECRTEKAVLILGGGKIQAILAPDTDPSALYPGCRIIDAAGQYILPGGVDGHVHFGNTDEIPIADDFYTGSLAALAGGTTTVMDFCEPVPGEDPLACIEARKAFAADSAVDYGLHYSFSENYRQELPRIPEILAAGISAFKVYTVYPNMALQPGDMFCVMEALGGRGTLLVHAEEASLIQRMKERYQAGGEDMTALALTRPGLSEQMAVETVLAAAKAAGAIVCIAHVSCGETVEILARERRAGNRRFLLESCPHYMQFTSERLAGPMGALYTMNPPLRTRADADRLMDAVLREEISILSTDHCPFLKSHKLGKTYDTVPCGVDGVGIRLPYYFSEAVLKRGLSMEAFVRLTASNAAKFYGLYPRKGTIAVGSDADLVFFDPNGSWKYGVNVSAGAADYTIYEGLALRGRCTRTIKGGRTVMENGIVYAQKGSGRFLRCAAPKA